MATNRLERWPALPFAMTLVIGGLAGSEVDRRPRNMKLKAFDPRRADFVCKREADANPALASEAKALFRQGMAVPPTPLPQWDGNEDTLVKAVIDA